MEEVKVTSETIEPTTGTAGLPTQAPGNPATVSAAAEATDGISAGNFIQPDIDDELFRFNSDDTPLMSLMLKAKKVKVDSPEVDHYMIDEPRSSVTMASAYTAQEGNLQAVLPLEAKDKNLLQPHTTVLVKGVNGYDKSGAETPGQELMLIVVGKDASTGNPIVRACNGVKVDDSEYTSVPDIPADTKLIILGNALYETQKEVAPDLIVPQPTRIYLQKRGMTQVVSDSFDSQKKRIPFTKAIIAEQAIANFKVRGNRTLWASRASKFKVDTGKLGMQYIYTTEGVRWQFKKELQHTGKWTVEKFIALAKMFFTGEDVPQNAIFLAGKNLLEAIQSIDYSKHPEIKIETKTNKVGWSVTNIHTVFGDFQIKREPTLDRLGWSNSGALIGEDRLVHYVYSNEHSFNENVEGEEAKRSGLLVWDGLGLKGSCHIWIDGEGDSSNSDATDYIMWDQETAPATTSSTGPVYYLLVDCPAINASAKAGQMWQHNGSAWSQYYGEVYAK
ncbi:MAG: hypothetical protein IKK27_00140 [Alistipes sp.]|nr:hypothetical protein [Alistipes sp.]